MCIATITPVKRDHRGIVILVVPRVVVIVNKSVIALPLLLLMLSSYEVDKGVII